MKKKRFGPTLSMNLFTRGLFLALLPLLTLSLIFYLFLGVVFLLAVLVSFGKNIFYRKALIQTVGNMLLQIGFFVASFIGVFVPRLGMLFILSSYRLFQKWGYKIHAFNRKILVNLANLSILFDVKQNS